jgi:hypothetical protein
MGILSTPDMLPKGRRVFSDIQHGQSVAELLRQE